MKKVVCVLLIFTSLISFSQSRQVKSLQNEIDKWNNYSFKQFVIDKDQSTIIIYNSNGIVSGVYPNWKEYSNSREYKFIFTPILPNGEYGFTITKYQTLNKNYNENDLKKYVISKIDELKTSIEEQLNLEKEARIRREKLKELERKKQEFIFLKKTEIEKFSDDFLRYNDSIIKSIEGRYEKVSSVSLENINKISDSLEVYFRILYKNNQGSYKNNLNEFSSEQFDFLNSKNLLGYYKSGFSNLNETFSPKYDDEYLIIDGEDYKQYYKYRYEDLKSLPQFVLSKSTLNWFSILNKHLDPDNGRILFEFSVYRDLVIRRDRYLKKFLRIDDLKNGITDGIKFWREDQIKKLEKEVFSFEIEKISFESKWVSVLRDLFSVYENRILKTGFIDENFNQTEKLKNLIDLSNKYSKFVSFYKTQFVPLLIDLDNEASYNGNIDPKKIDKVIKSLTKDLQMSNNNINDYKKIVTFLRNGSSVDEKLKLAYDFIGRLDSNPIDFPVDQIRNLKIFK